MTEGGGAPHHRRIGDIVLMQRFTWRWTAGFALSLLLVLVLVVAVTLLFRRGVGIWGTNIPFVWAFDITNYVWWIGISNAASLVAATLVLRRAKWRTSINRFAETTALVAVICAGLFPILHLGRPWLFHWVFPYPAAFGVWPQFRSPLVWDFFAILTHIVVTALFWYVGLIPDLAHLRDRAEGRRTRRFFAVLALGWRGSARHWYNHEIAYRLLAALTVPLVVFMQSAVALEFTITLVPSWHQLRLPPYFVVSGLASGLALVLVIALLIRRLMELHEVITERHVDIIAWLIAASGLVIGVSYGFEAFFLWNGGETARDALRARAAGPLAPLYWGVLTFAALLPQALWLERVRRGFLLLLTIGLGVTAGIWIDRLLVVVGGLWRTHVPSIERGYFPSLWEWPLLLGTVGLFAALMLLFVRFVPVISLFETHAKGRLPGEDG